MHQLRLLLLLTRLDTSSASGWLSKKATQRTRRGARLVPLFQKRLLFLRSRLKYHDFVLGAVEFITVRKLLYGIEVGNMRLIQSNAGHFSLPVGFNFRENDISPCRAIYNSFGYLFANAIITCKFEHFKNNFPRQGITFFSHMYM
jgi:hypothetical protein